MQAAAGRTGLPTLGEALRGLAAFLLFGAAVLGIVAALLYAGERPGPPPSTPSWQDVAEALVASGPPPLEAARYVASMAGWAILTYVAVVLLLRAVAATAVAATRGAAWAHGLERLVDVVTVPWVKRGVSGGLLAALFVASMVRVAPELPRLSLDGGAGAAPPAAAVVEAPVEAGQPSLAGAAQVAEAPRPEPEAAAPAGPGPSRASRQAPAPRPELPAPVVGAAGREQPQRGAQPGGDEEAAPEEPGVRAPGVRLPGEAGGRR